MIVKERQKEWQADLAADREAPGSSYDRKPELTTEGLGPMRNWTISRPWYQFGMYEQSIDRSYYECVS